MLKIYIARHGENLDNKRGILNGHRDEPLTNKGIGQAEQIAKEIKDSAIHFDVVYSSPLQRAFDTAKIISNIAHTPFPKKENLLIERDFGIMTGKKVSEIETLCMPNIIKTEKVTYFLNPEGAETFSDLIDRAKILLDKIRKNHQSGSILLVAHGDIGKMIYTQYYQLDWRNVLTQFHFDNCDLILLSEDSPANKPYVFK